MLVVFFILSHFNLKWWFPYGNYGCYGKLLVYDSDHDGKIELIFRRYIPNSLGVYFVEFIPPDSWNIQESQTVDTVLIWEVGDFDLDGFSDLVCYGCVKVHNFVKAIISIYESSDSFSYPSTEVWRDTVGQTSVIPICSYDVDRDGLPEIINNNGGGYPNWVWVYESFGNNQYDTIFSFSPMAGGVPRDPCSVYAFGDFDKDGKIEFVMGDLGGSSTGAPYWVYESPDNNIYQEVHQGYLPTLNVRDCFTSYDADCDGKLEFVVKGFTVPNAQTQAFIFEATGNNTYQIIKSFNLPNNMHWDYSGGYSDVGDVDGDGIPEICLESAFYVYVIKSSGNDSFYVWQTLPGNATGSSVRVIDIDGNGLSEIIISGNDQTRIYEKGIDIVIYHPSYGDTFIVGTQETLRFKIIDTISVNSGKLWLRKSDNSREFISSINPSDTAYIWVVPPIPGEPYWIEVCAYGPGRKDSLLSPPFRILQLGIEENNEFLVFSQPFYIYPTLFKDELNIVPLKEKDIKLKIYDSSGRVGKYINKIARTSQIYFIYLKTKNYSTIKKIIKIK
jgi:hypothetical protein